MECSMQGLPINPFRDGGYYSGQLIMLSRYRVYERVNMAVERIYNYLTPSHLLITNIQFSTVTVLSCRRREIAQSRECDTRGLPTITWQLLSDFFSTQSHLPDHKHKIVDGLPSGFIVCGRGSLFASTIWQ